MTDLQLENLTLEIDDDGVATLLLDREGDSFNSLGPELATDLFAAIEHLETNDAVTAVVIGSAKADNFLSGADIRWLRGLDDAATAREFLQRAHAGFSRIEKLTSEHGKPVVAAIHGACLGGGTELALACSMRIASNDEMRTQLGQPEVKLGLIPGVGGTQRLPRLVGIAAALDLILTGRSVRPRRALKMGLVDEAIGEFQLAAKDARYLVDCCSLLATCFLEKGFPELAIKWYKEGLESPTISEEETLGLWYELGELYFSIGEEDQARQQFVEIYGINSSYRDVGTRLEQLGEG